MQLSAYTKAEGLPPSLRLGVDLGGGNAESHCAMFDLMQSRERMRREVRQSEALQILTYLLLVGRPGWLVLLLRIPNRDQDPSEPDTPPRCRKIEGFMHLQPRPDCTEPS